LGIAVYALGAWDRLRSYDFSSPEAAIKSQFEMLASWDYAAILQLELADQGITSTSANEMNDTLRIHHSESVQDYVILYYSFQQNGIPKREAQAYEKASNGSTWTTTTLPVWKDDVEDLQEASTRMESWAEQGELPK
jgi:hypothetical protein